MSGPNPSPTPPATVRAASREHDSSEAFSSLAPGAEIRRILVAQGIEATEADLERDAAAEEAAGRPQGAAALRGWKIPSAIRGSFEARRNSASRRGRAFADQLVFAGSNRAIYFSAVQNIVFDLRVTTSKSEFKQALETPLLHVIYEGHARYGRGPCFGTDHSPGEDWENGTDRAERGLFRMGFPFIAVPLSEILEHGYTCNPVICDGSPPPPRSDCDPDMRGGRLREFTFDDLRRSPRNPRREQYTEDQLRPHFPAAVAGPVRVWGYDGYEHGNLERHVVMHAGWEDTVSAPFDLGATQMACKVFCHFGCSTFSHNYPVVRRRKNWCREVDNYYAYWTTAPSGAATARHWIDSLFTYPERNDFQSWRESIEWTVRQTNRELRRIHETYQLI